jgi:tetratricopeptide (TPR) repeat protein
MRQLLVLVLVSAVGWGCAAKKPSASALEAARLAREAAELKALAESRTLQGCYDCLLEAKAAYAKLATGAERPQMLVRLFETELLIALRERELAIDAAPAIARARALVSELPPTLQAERYVKVVEAVPADSTGLPVAADIAFRRSKVQYVAGLDAEIVWLMGNAVAAQGTSAIENVLALPVRQYLALSLDCSYFRRARPPAPAPVAGLAATPPVARQVVIDQIPKDAPVLLQYRVGTCYDLRKPPLEAVRKEEPRYAEAAYFLARIDIARANETGAPTARPLLAEAYGRFANSPAVTYLAGNYNQLIGDCKAGLKYYDETVAIEPLHDNALLGRTICLAFLKRFDESIASATRMIAIPSTNLADAYYWRAWVRHYLKDLPLARADIDQAKKILSNNSIHRLAGIIEHDQDDLENADKDLTVAKSMTDGQYDCVARWYLGLNDMKRERWAVSAAHFEDAMNCYERAALFAQDGLRKMQAAENVDPDFKARQITGFEAAIKEDTAQQYASAFNAANHYARAGDVTKAKALLGIAARDPALEPRVAELRKLLGGG